MAKLYKAYQMGKIQQEKIDEVSKKIAEIETRKGQNKEVRERIQTLERETEFWSLKLNEINKNIPKKFNSTMEEFQKKKEELVQEKKKNEVSVKELEAERLQIESRLDNVRQKMAIVIANTEGSDSVLLGYRSMLADLRTEIPQSDSIDPHNAMDRTRFFELVLETHKSMTMKCSLLRSEIQKAEDEKNAAKETYGKDLGKVESRIESEQTEVSKVKQQLLERNLRVTIESLMERKEFCESKMERSKERLDNMLGEEDRIKKKKESLQQENAKLLARQQDCKEKKILHEHYISVQAKKYEVSNFESESGEFMDRVRSTFMRLDEWDLSGRLPRGDLSLVDIEPLGVKLRAAVHTLKQRKEEGDRRVETLKQVTYSIREQVRRNEEIVNSLVKEIQASGVSMSAGSNMLEEYSHLKTQRDEARDKLLIEKFTSKDLYRDFIKRTRDSSKCSFCKQPLTKHTIDNIEGKFKDREGKIDQSIKEEERQLLVLESKCEKLKKLKPKFEAMDKASTELKAQKSRLHEKEQETEEVQQIILHSIRELEERQMKLTELEEIQKGYSGQSQRRQKITHLRGEINKIEANELKGYGSETYIGGMYDPKEEDEIMNKMKAGSLGIEQLSGEEKKIAKAVMDLREEIEKNSREFSVVERELAERKVKEAELNELQAKLSRLEDSVRRLKEEKHALMARQRQVERVLNDMTEKKNELENAQKQSGRIETFVAKVKEFNDSLQRMEQKKSREEAIREERTMLQSEIDSLAKRKSEIDQQLRECNVKLQKIPEGIILLEKNMEALQCNETLSEKKRDYDKALREAGDKVNLTDDSALETLNNALKYHAQRRDQAKGQEELIKTMYDQGVVSICFKSKIVEMGWFLGNRTS